MVFRRPWQGAAKGWRKLARRGNRPRGELYRDATSCALPELYGATWSDQSRCDSQVVHAGEPRHWQVRGNLPQVVAAYVRHPPPRCQCGSTCAPDHAGPPNDRGKRSRNDWSVHAHTTRNTAPSNRGRFAAVAAIAPIRRGVRAWKCVSMPVGKAARNTGRKGGLRMKPQPVPRPSLPSLSGRGLRGPCSP